MRKEPRYCLIGSDDLGKGATHVYYFDTEDEFLTNTKNVSGKIHVYVLVDLSNFNNYVEHPHHIENITERTYQLNEILYRSKWFL